MNGRDVWKNHQRVLKPWFWLDVGVPSLPVNGPAAKLNLSTKSCNLSEPHDHFKNKGTDEQKGGYRVIDFYNQI